MFLVLGFYNLTFVVITAVKPPRLNCIGRLALACHRECTLSSRGTKRSRLCHRERSVVLCHRERSVVLCHRERNNLVIASAARRSLLSALANPKARLLLRLSCHRERSVAISPFGHRKVALSSRGEFVIARNVAISVVQGWRTVKREVASQARNDRIPFAGSQ